MYANQLLLKALDAIRAPIISTETPRFPAASAFPAIATTTGIPPQMEIAIPPRESVSNASSTLKVRA